MPDKKYLIEIPDMPDGSGVWDADKWERNKDAFMADYPNAQVFELGEYDEADSQESDQILLSFEDEASSGIWDQAKWERNKYAFTKDNPEAQVSRVRYVDYWGQKAEANRAEKAALQQPDEERNAKLAEIGYYDDITGGQVDFSLDAPSTMGLKPLSSAVEESATGETTYHDPRVKEFFANDTAETERQAEIARLDAEYDSNPSVIAYREWMAGEAEREAEDRKQLRGNLNAFLNEEIDHGKAGRAMAGKRTSSKYGMSPYIPSSDEVAENERREKAMTALKLLEKADIVSDVAGKGFWAAAGDQAQNMVLDAGTQSDIEAYNEIGDILTSLEEKLGNLNEETITPEVIEENLSAEDQMLIQSFFKYNAAMANAQKDMSRAYKGGKIFAESVPFMLEFLVTGGVAAAGEAGVAGAARAAEKGIAKALVKWVTKKAAGKAARMAVARGVQKASTAVIKGLASTALRTIAGEGTYKRMAEASLEIDENGHLNRAKNSAVAFADMYVENLSEISGGIIGETLGLLGKGAGWLIGKTPLSKIGGMLGDNVFMQGLSKFGNGVKAFMPKLEALGFHGLPEEIGEEFIGNTIRELVGIQPGALKEMVSDDNFGAMLIGFAPMTLLGVAGGVYNLGVVNAQAAKLGKDLREKFGSAYTEEELDHMMSVIQNAQTAEDIQKALKPMAMAAVNSFEKGMITEEQMTEQIEMLYQYGGFMAQNNALLFGKKAQDRQMMDAKREEFTAQLGRFWQEDQTETVQVATLNNGSTVFVTSAPAEDGKITIVDAVTGRKGFANVSDIATREVDGEQIQSSNSMTMDAFLNGQIAMQRKTAEETRMNNERNAQIEALAAQITPGTRINLGTEGSPVIVYAGGTNKRGVVIVDETGMESTLGWEQAAYALGQPIKVETDQQKLDAEISERLQRMAERRMQRAVTPASQATVEAAEGAAEVVAQEQQNIPLNEDGTVNEALFWTQDPEGYVKWNDEQNQDGGQDSLKQIAISKQELFGMLNEAATGQNTSNPTMRKAAEKQVAAIAEKIARLEALEMSYADALAEEKEAVKQTQATPTATMSEEQLEQMDAQYQGILGKTRIQSERVRVMQEYLDKLAENSAPIKVLTKDNYEEVMRAEGCPEDDIKRVGKALNRKRGGQVAGFASNGVTFVMANTIADINSARITYIHERQHLLNSQNPEVVKQFAAALGDKENALRILETFVDKNGLEEYKNDSIEKLADEIICRSMEIVYSTENYSVDLQNQGLSEEAINIINTIDNGQRTDKSLSSARRSSYVNGSRRENIEENGRNSEQVSGGILGEQEAGSLGSSGRGDGLRGQGSTGEGAEVISEEQLNAPNSREAQQITAADGEVLADTDGKGGVRFSIRTWNEGGRDYLAAWLANDTILTDDEKADILARMDEFYKNALLYSDTYAPFGTWSDAGVRYDNNGNPLMSVIKANGDYAMNLDFSLVCKKRRPLNRLLRTLVNRNAFATYTLRERELAEINWILQEHGFEVACALCFVDSKRYRVTGVADVFAALYNRLVKSLAPEGVQIAHFNYNENPNVEVVENGLDTMSDDQLNWDRFDRILSAYKPGSVEHKVAQYLREHPEARKLVDATDFIEAEGFESVKENNPDLLKFYNMKKGTGGPKASFGDVQYLNDILKKEKSFDAEKAYAVGGVRLQSFSDFVPHMYFDYMQLFAELAAKKLPLHAYTKEVLFAKIFGLTGAKINMSLVPAVVEGGIAPGLDAEGNYAWADPVIDAEGSVIQQGQSFPYDEAMAIQQAEGYSKNCGVIAVGISDAHIEKMLDDPNIPFIIPYHKSSLNAIVARMTNIDQYKDYTNVQNTRKASGSKLDKGTKDFNFNEYLHGLGESGTPQQAAQAYLDWCRENNYKPKFSQFAYHPNYYKLLQDFNTIDLATGEYAPQGAVTMTFPTEESAFGNVETLIQQGLQEDAELEEKMEQEIDGIADQVLARLEEISKEPKMSEKQQAKKMAELADERTAKIKAKAKGPIDLVEEARKADLRHRVAAERTLVPGHKKGQPMLSDAEMMADVSFRITKNTKATIEKWFNKAGVDAEMTEATINYLDYAFEDTTEQLCAAKWYLNGKISLPDEDEYKVRDAVKVAKQNKVDALSYASPMDILNTFGQPKSKVKPIDPDTVKEFSNKKELAEGIVVYDVQDDFEGQAAVRKIIDTHWGEDANPWCLAARTNGDLERAKDMWLHYSKYPKRIAFRNGKLLAFYASANDKTWWDRNDEPHTNIPYSVKSKEGEYEVSTNYELKEGNKKAKKVSVGKSDKKGRTAYFVGNRLESAGIQDGERNLFYSSFPAGATLSDSTYGVGRSIEIQYGPYKNVTQISFERRTKGEPTYYVRVGYGQNGVRAISFVEDARSWDIRYGINGDQIFVGRAQLNFDLTDELSNVYSGAYHMYRINDEEYEIARGRKKVGIVKKGEKVTMQMLEAFGEDGAPAGALLDFINDMGWNRSDYPYPNPADADLLRRDDEVREQIRKVENEINEIAGGRYLSSVPAIRFRTVRTDEQREQLFEKAKEHYGLTNNFNASGYMLPDGSLLDFSEANDGGDPNRRSLDHRDIEGLIMDEGKEYDSRYHYVVDFVDEGAIRMLPEAAGFQLSVPPTAEQRSRLMDYIYKHNGEVIMEITDENGSPRVYMEYNRRTSPSRIFSDMDRFFNEGVVPGIPPLRFRIANDNQAIFVSNAAKAVEGIKQEKATPEQWLKMIEKNGGLKAGEDKWMGLSDWLKSSDKKTLTKQEVLDFINENMIQIEEQHYSSEGVRAEADRILNERYPGWEDAFSFDWDPFMEEPHSDIYDEVKAARLYNETHEDQVETDEDGDIVNDADYNKVEEFGAELAGIWYGRGRENTVREINGIREEYTTNGLTNLHEIALTVPTIESWNESDEVHFGDAGDGRAVAWIRFGDTQIIEEGSLREYEPKNEIEKQIKDYIEFCVSTGDSFEDSVGYAYNMITDAPASAPGWTEEIVTNVAEGMRAKAKIHKVLVIDEIQSKRHQEGRERGYISKEKERELREKFEKAKERFFALDESLREKYGSDFVNAESNDEYMEILIPEDYREYMNAQMDFSDARLEMNNPRYDAVPDAPFDKNWHELAMKRMLRYAAENGYDVIAWTKGEQQADRYNLGKIYNEIEREDNPNIEGRTFSFSGGNYDKVTVNEDGVVVDSTIEEAKGKSLSDLVGKDLAVKMMSLENYDTIDEEDLRIGGEGMKGFYDKMLPAFMNKYGKKWGVKVEDIELPNLENGLTMHSVPVTEEMKASVMEGQVMFRIRGEKESAEDFYNSVVEEYKAKYTELGFIETYPINEETANEFGYTLEELEKIGGNYDPETNISAIFVHEDANDSVDVEGCIFHEQIHFLAEAFPYMKELGKWMRENAETSSYLSRIKETVDAEYEEYWKDEEMLSHAVSVAMAAGVVSELEQMVPQEHRGIISEIEKEIGYDRATEESSRRAGQNLSRAESEEYTGQTSEKKVYREFGQELSAEESIRFPERVHGVSEGQEASPASAGSNRQGRKSNASEGRTLTAEERRVINEYFPGAFAEPIEQATNESELRYRVVSDQETLDRLNSEPTIKVYRAMQLIDGKLYPPMSAKVDGELRQPIELGQWEEAEERPDLVDEKGRFKLDKGNKSSLKARYNPYFHTSPTPLNDQFSSAQTRPELVTVEVEVPESELTSGYKAAKAKDSVGKMEWKAGVVQSKLSGTRTVILSRWDKPVRIVPDSEVADVIVDMFEGRDITMPSNVVTPSLRAELEKRGVPFVETDNQGNPVEEVSFRVTGTPTDEVVANGLQLTPAQTAEVAANIFAALPEESRKKITEGLNGNVLGLKDAILQIPASLASKENWNEEDKQMAAVVRDVIQGLVDANPTSRPLTTKEALWMLYDSTNTVKDLVDAASRAFVAHNLGFDSASMQRKQEVNDYLRFRTASNGAIDAATDMYNYETSLWTERLKESWLDMNQSVVSLQKAMAEASGMPIEPWENLEYALNRLSSKSYADKKKYLRDFLMPMWDTILDIVKHDHVSIEEIERYMMLKHGLERNKKFASRDAKEFYRAMYDLVAERMKNQSHAQQVVALSEAKKRLADIDAQIAVASSSQLPRLNEARAKAQYDVDVADLVLRGDEQQNEAELQAYYDAVDNEVDPKYREFREKDYGGLTSMFVDTTDVKRSDYKSEEAYQKAVLAATTPRYDDVAAMESAAEREVSLFENKVYMHRALWDKVNAATKETLRHQYESGMITLEQYEAVRDMFEFYVPLRGFADNTAEDMYSYYMNNSTGGFTKPILGAKGRKTRAESPLGWIGTMAESAIQSDNKNQAKMCLYYMTLRRPDQNLLTITETWYEYTGQKDANGKKIFKAAYPPATDRALNADELRQHMEDWENDMKQKQSRGEAYKGSQRVDLKGSVIFQDEKEEKEHIVRVKVAGKDYSILINGNPRAAQAINGLLNPDANVGPVAQWIGNARRSLSALLTSYSPLFWVANFQRDLLSSAMRVSEADGWDVAMKYLANRRKAWRVASYIYKYDAGTLGDSYYERLYKEFAENGGITGYTSLTTNKEYEELFKKYADNVDKDALNAVKGIWDKFMGFGEAIEQVSRFAAFITAREDGKSIEEAINAAKEVSVNFNRKGSAKPISLDELDKLRTKDGKKLNKAQRIAALALSAMPGPMKFCYYFVNASIQALSSSAKLAKKSPGKATTWVGMYMGTSIALAMLNYLLSDDDDDEYLNLPDYLRHSTALVKVADGYYFKWSIPQEMRPFYAWADILVRKMMGKMPHKNGKEVGKEMALAASQWLPVNPFDAEDPLLSVIPDFLSPLAEVKANTNAFGGKIYDDMAFKSEGVVKEIPAYRKATEKTGDIYVDISEFLNDVSGGDEVTKGKININPAIMEHLIEGYGGGIYDFAEMMVSIPSMILSDDPVQVKEIPFVNKVILSVDETNMYSHTNEAFRHYKDVADNAKRVEKEYRESDDPSRADAYREEEDWRIYLLYKEYEKDFKDVKERLDDAVDKEEEKLLKQEQNVLREMFLDDIAKGDIPEVTFQIREDVKRIDKEVKAVMKPVTEANKERIERRNAGDVDGMLEAIERRDSLKETPEYKRAEELNKDLKEIKQQLKELGSVTRGSQRDSVIGELQKNYDALIQKMEQL